MQDCSPGRRSSSARCWAGTWSPLCRLLLTASTLWQKVLCFLSKHGATVQVPRGQRWVHSTELYKVCEVLLVAASWAGCEASHPPGTDTKQELIASQHHQV